MYQDIGWAFIFMAWYPNFQLYILYSDEFGINIFTHCGLCKDTCMIEKNACCPYTRHMGVVQSISTLIHGLARPRASK